MRFQPGEGRSWGLLRDCKIFANFRITFVSSSNLAPHLRLLRHGLAHGAAHSGRGAAPDCRSGRGGGRGLVLGKLSPEEA